MKVKVGDKIYSGNEQPVMVILTDADKENIASMHPKATRYTVFPVDLGWTEEEMIAWMKEGIE